MYITKKGLILINIFLIIIEVVFGYLIINSFLTNDLISPNNGEAFKYIKIKTSNIVNIE